MTIVEDKAELRRRMLARREAIEPSLRQAGAARLASAVVGRIAPMVRPPGVVSVFLAIGSEPDTAGLIANLGEAGYVAALPVMVAKAAPLVFRAWRPGDPLIERAWGIREPADTLPAVEPDVLLVPLLAFDRAGGRLGYGGGYYDRTLHALRRRRPVIAVGVAFDEQEVDAVPRSDYDERIDWIMTPSAMISRSP
ncbi:MAG: 5-formyltetrahydrofolate cyclo-ligase [Hyphomicrobiales bacterium]|nr:5-formyltetrahydrofolate cyclo-ligase [Hyphomicrobiales bacterium]